MTRLLGIGALVLLPGAALAYTAIHLKATGADGGVLWLIGFGTVLLGILAAACYAETRP